MATAKLRKSPMRACSCFAAGAKAATEPAPAGNPRSPSGEAKSRPASKAGRPAGLADGLSAACAAVPMLPPKTLTVGDQFFLMPPVIVASQPMGQTCKDYEIRLHRRDGTLSLVMIVPATGDDDAKLQAKKMLRADLANAHVWDADGKLVGSIYRLQ
jgi:hypothetical protein